MMRDGRRDGPGPGRPLPADYKRLHEAYGSPFAQNGLFVSAPGELLSTHLMLAGTLSEGSRTGKARAGPVWLLMRCNGGA